MFGKISFIGAGSMAESIISGILAKNVIHKKNIFVTNKNNQERLDRLQARFDVQCIPDNKEKVINGADAVILSMKPYDIEVAVESVKEYIHEDMLIISVLAGISTDYISQLIGKPVPIVRAMPNTSAALGYSATALTAGKDALPDHIKKSEFLFQTIGTTTVVKEDDMHTVTGISGSGPAYIYYLVEAMELAAVESGLEKDVAMELITQTVVGAGEMLKHSGETADILRKKITSPKGTTEAGLKALDKHHFQETIIDCVKSARDRSIELGKMV